MNNWLYIWQVPRIYVREVAIDSISIGILIVTEWEGLNGHGKTHELSTGPWLQVCKLLVGLTGGYHPYGPSHSFKVGLGYDDYLVDHPTNRK